MLVRNTCDVYNNNNPPPSPTSRGVFIYVTAEDLVWYADGPAIRLTMNIQEGACRCRSGWCESLPRDLEEVRPVTVRRNIWTRNCHNERHY